MPHFCASQEYRAKLKPGLKVRSEPFSLPSKQTDCRPHSLHQAGAGNVDNRLKDLTALVETQAHHLNLLSSFLVPHGFPGLQSPLVVKDESRSPQENQLDLGGSSAGGMDPSSTSSGGVYSSLGLSTRSRDGDGQEPVEMLSVGSSSTATNPALLPLPHPLYTLGLNSQQQHQQQQHPFASPHTAAETLLGLSGSSFMSGSQAEFGGGGGLTGAGPSRLRQEDVSMSENGNVYVSLRPFSTRVGGRRGGADSLSPLYQW